MLTEVAFCLSAYFGVLTIEYLPLILSNRKLNEIREFNIFGDNLHHVMALFAAAGTFLSFFHQGSLGGLFGVLFGRPFAFREVFLYGRGRSSCLSFPLLPQDHLLPCSVYG